MLAASPQPGAGRVPDSLSTCMGSQIDGQTPRQTPSQGDVWGQPQRGCASPQQTAGAPRLLDKLPTAPPAGPSCTTGGKVPPLQGTWAIAYTRNPHPLLWNLSGQIPPWCSTPHSVGLVQGWIWPHASLSAWFTERNLSPPSSSFSLSFLIISRLGCWRFAAIRIAKV